MSKKRFGDRRLNAMSHAQLLAYAKSITRDHGRAQESINRLRVKLRMWEAGTPPAPFAPRPRIVLRPTAPALERTHHRRQEAHHPHQGAHQPHQEAHHARTV